ncbi:GNAT family acetyltransferase [Staphylococcus petrasii]|uniref:GNAT family N-acetyltransferase n=1 Tax=Staphylococcus petrasii TaxID=1276936 RepID=A0A380G3G5_9STAP|nr:GNAT family N-acetyltransferase [Staphylococcus petrasii]PNZ24954.1 N-acetyltransferase [Staphylococcus petrasii]TGE10923.1 GNAT family N-acetyltransferase [Staphylococcus petrasii]TGE15134.1 GNAT family N-acetyltransferase [Staphylococcus petrasii]SUM44803.1 GNAT family acetyltransferase [Staphylococcus petrasii]
MSDIHIEKGRPQHQEGGQLTYAAIDNMAEVILGKTNEKELEADLQKLWKNHANRFSHEFSFVAMQDEKVLGAITCAPLEQIEKAMTPTVLQIISMNKLKPFLSIARHPKRFYALVSMEEGQEDEYHISMLATMPDTRGKGVGGKLLDYAEQQALENGFSKISLTVVKDNDKAVRLYKKQGFEIVGNVDHPPFHLYQMRKELK